MFWKKKDKGKGGAKAPDAAKKGANPTREQILAQARANAAAARAEIGDETLDRIKEALLKQQSAIEQAKAKIKAADQDKVRDHLQFMMREDKPDKPRGK